MRSLEKNKVNLWKLDSAREVEVLDDDGYFTGEIMLEYDPPTPIKLMLYPASGDVAENSFGTSIQFDMLSVTNDIVLKQDTLLFKEEPIGNYDTTYDYKVVGILKSLNSYQYALRGRK